MSTVAQEILSREQVGGFVDVLGSRAQWPAADDGEGGSYLIGRRRLPLPDGPVTIESAILSSGRSGEAVLPGDEFVLVLSGAVRFRQKGRELRIGAGEAAVVLRGQPLEWSADEPAGLIVMRCTAGSADELVVIDTSAPLSRLIRLLRSCWWVRRPRAEATAIIGLHG